MTNLPETAREIVLARRPEGTLAVGDFRIETKPLSPAGPGEVVVRTRYIAIDPANRARITGKVIYSEPLPIGQAVEAMAVGEVVASNHSEFPVGANIVGALGWREYWRGPVRGLQVIADDRLPASTAIGVVGLPGMTAYFGLRDTGAIEAGETVLITSAAGGVGATAGQIARLSGCRVIGVAGGPEKCRWLKEELRFDAVVDRHAPDFAQALAAACEGGIDVYFDNVGNAMIETVLPLMKMRGRIVLCGQIADYDSASPPPGLVRTDLLIAKRLRMEGTVVYDYAQRFDMARAEMIPWILAGELIHREEFIDGFENLPEALVGLFRGDNFGRRIVRLY